VDATSEAAHAAASALADQLHADPDATNVVIQDNEGRPLRVAWTQHLAHGGIQGCYADINRDDGTIIATVRPEAAA